LINSGAPSVSSTAPSWCPGRILGSPSRWWHFFKVCTHDCPQQQFWKH
jgi:hypothetical protein